MKKVSVILVDWNVRESFHAIDYLKEQTIPRNDYEIIWVEYYDNRPKPIQEHVDKGNIDKWIVLNKTGMYIKHLMYNEGIVASTGEIVVICDSDAIFSPTFIESIVTTFDEHKDEDIVLYLEEVRNDNRCFYPFKNVSWETIMETPGLINWDSVAKKPSNLTTTHDIIHRRNYGACFCATRKSIIEAGGYDEHSSYHSFLCGPYELGWRLVSKGYREIWHQSEWLLHVWHPWVRPGIDIMGESDGKGLNSVALEIRKTGRVAPLVENEKIRYLRTGRKNDVTTIAQKEGIVSQDAVPGKPIENRSKLMNYYNRFWSKTEYLFRMEYWQTPVRVTKVLIVRDWNHGELLYRTIKYTGLVLDVQQFIYDDWFLYNKLDQQKMSEDLIERCRQFRPDLIILVPLIDAAEQSLSNTVEPTQDSIRRIMNELGAKVYVHNFDSTKCIRYDEWFPLVNYVGIIDSLSEFDKYADNPQIIRGYPAVNPIDFYNGNIERDINVCFWGSIPINSKREEYVNFLRDNGINVYTHIHRVSVEKYAEILNRSKISLSICHDGEGENRLRVRAFEIMACKSLLLEDDISETKRLFDVDKDFVIFRNKEELLEKVKYYLQHEEQRKLIAQSGYDKVTNIYNARNMWGDIFKNMGFDDKNGGVYLKVAHLCSRSLQLIISKYSRWIIHKIRKWR